LDGWNRHEACKIAGVKPIFTTYTGRDPVAYVKSLNWARRHMDAGQRAQAIVALSNWREAGRPKTGSQEPISTKTIPQMAAEAGVAPATIKAAKAVQASGDEGLRQSVINGEIPVRKAA